MQLPIKMYDKIHVVYEKTNIIYEEANMQQLEDIEKITIFEREEKEYAQSCVRYFVDILLHIIT
jgi:hypothetical protein